MLGGHSIIKSDLVDELLESSQQNTILGEVKVRGKYGLKVFSLCVDKILSSQIHKSVGRYETINCNRVFSYLKPAQDYVAKHIALSLSSFFENASRKTKFLVVGLGNACMVADSLGSVTGKKLLVTAGVPEKYMGELGEMSYIEPKVQGQTGIATFDIIKGVVDRVKPDIVITIDALCARNVERLLCSFQLCNVGISPGGGVGNKNKILNKDTLGCEVISIGVPLMIAGEDLGVYDKNLESLHFTVKEIDFYVNACANILSNAINSAIHGNKYKKFQI